MNIPLEEHKKTKKHYKSYVRDQHNQYKNNRIQNLLSSDISDEKLTIKNYKPIRKVRDFSFYLESLDSNKNKGSFFIYVNNNLNPIACERKGLKYNQKESVDVLVATVVM